MSRMSEIAERFRRRAASFTERVEAVPADRWDSPSPCEGWTALDVVRHMVGNVDMFFGLVGRERSPGPDVADAPAAVWGVARDAMQVGLDDPELAGQEYDGAFGRMTFEQGVDSFLSFDLVVHTWDLARATGLDERLDPTDVHDVFESAKSMDTGGALRTDGVCGPELAPPSGAGEQEQMLAFLGRAV